MRSFEYQGQTFQFPDETPDDEALGFISKFTTEPSWAEVVQGAKPAATRELAKAGVGMSDIYADVTGDTALHKQNRATSAEIQKEEQAQPPMGTLKQGVQSGLVSALVNAPIVAATMGAGAIGSIATRAGITGAELMGAGTTGAGIETGLSKYGDMRDAEFGPGRSALQAAMHGLIEKYTEYLPLRELNKAGPWAEHLYKFLGKDLLGEQVATLGQDVNDALSTRPDMTLGDFLHDQAVTAISTALGGPLQAGVVRAAQAAFTPFIRPQNITPDQQRVLDTANAASQGLPPPPPFPWPTGPSPVETPAPNIPQPLVDASAKLPAVAPTATRLYTVVPEVDNGEEHTTWTPDLEKIQQILAVSGQGVRVPYVDVDTASLATSQEGENVQAIRNEQNVGADDYVLPTSLAREGTQLWPPTAQVEKTGEGVAPTTSPNTAANTAPEPQAQPGPSTATVSAPNSGPAVTEKETPTPTNLGMINTNPNGTKVRLKFANALDKALYLFALHNEPTSSVPQKQRDEERAALSQQLGIPESEVLRRAQYYHNTIAPNIAQLKGGQVAPHAFSEEDFKAETAKGQDVEANRLKGIAAGATPGQVSLAPGLPKTKHTARMQSFLQQWVNIFLPGTKLVIVDVADKGKSPSYRVVDGVGLITVPSPDSTSFSAVFSLAHEFGHHIQMSVLGRDTHAEADAQLRLEHARAVEATKGQTARQFIQSWMAPGKVGNEAALLKRYGVGANDGAGLLVKAIDAKMYEGYLLSYEEWLAEQFSRYVGKKYDSFMSGAVKGALTKILLETKQFFSKIVKKISPSETYEKFIDALRAAPLTVEDVNAVQARVLSEGVWFDSVDEEYGFTLRTLNRLPKKEKVLKQTVESELKRADVKDQERDLLWGVLATFDGDVVNKTELQARVAERLVPLTLTETNKWAEYGVRQVNQKPLMRTATTIFQLPFELSTANHFGDPKYFGHSRDFQAQGDDAINIVELQSDLVQKAGASSELDPDTELAFINKYEEMWKKSLEINQRYLEEKGETGGAGYYVNSAAVIDGLRNWVYSTEKDEYNADQVRRMPAKELIRVGVERGLIRSHDGYDYLVDWMADDVKVEYMKVVQDAINRAELKLVELGVKRQNLLERQALNIPEKIKTLPTRWWEFMLRALNKQYSTQGIKVARMAGADTVAKVEGWPSTTIVSSLKGKVITTGHGKLDSFTLTGEINPLGGSYLNGWTVKGHYTDSSGIPDLDTESINEENLPDYLQREIAEAVFKKAFKQDYGKMQGIYNRYAREITNFVKKEFGAREVEIDGNKWYEWDVKPDLNGVGVEYYDLNDNVKEQGLTIGEVLQKSLDGDVPEMSASFKRMQGFFQNTLQLNQLAKLLPTITPLQVYRRLMQQMTNLKNQMMVGPNQRIKEWYALSKKDSLGVMQMLKDEADSGAHWTQLDAHTVILEGGKPQVVWNHTVTDKVRAEAARIGVSERAVSVYLGVKNDMLNSLGQMETTLVNSINEFYAKNPIAGGMRIVVAQKQFDNFRKVPYIPEKRFGQWSVIIRAKNATTRNGISVKEGEIVWFSGHRRKWQQGREYEKLVKEFGGDFAVTKDYIEDQPFVLRSLPRDFVNSLPEALQLTPEQLDRFNQLYYDATKEGSYLKLLGQGKKRTPGAEQDLRQQYADYMWRTSNLISKMAFSRKLQRELFNLNALATKAGKLGGDATPLRRLHEHLRNNFDYVIRPQHEWEQLRAVVSLWYLYGVPKTALMNLMSLPTMSYPRLAAQVGDAKATSLILGALKDVSLYWRHPEKVSPEIAALFAQGNSDGILKQSFAAELAAVADGNAIERMMPSFSFLSDSGLRDRTRKYAWKLIHWGMIPFQVTEEFNRRVTLLAAYRAEKSMGRQGLDQTVGEGSAYMGARDTVDFTQNDYSGWNRAKLLQGKKSVALIFYSFMQNASFFMFGGDKGWWRGLLALGALGGVMGLPGAENVVDFLNWVGRVTLGKPVDLHVEARELAQAVGLNPDFVLHGAMHNMFGLGWDTSNSVSMGRIIPGTDALFGQGDASNRILQMAGEVGGPFGSLSVSVLKALFDSNPNLLLRFDQALPPLVRNIERGYRGAVDDEWVDTKGRPLTDSASGPEIAGQLLGFSPTSKTSIQEERFTQKEAAVYYTLRRANLMAAYDEAALAKDSEGIADAKQAIRSYNESVPSPTLRVTGEELQQSLKAHEKSEKEKLTGVPSQKRYLPVYQSIAEAFP